jgi:multisubunit Na+/H+ antiporter MnhG subunit
LLAVGSLLTLACALGTASMRDPLQRLHFVAPPSTLGASLVTAALFLDDGDLDVGCKGLFATLLLVLMNGVATHATARAARVHLQGSWLPGPSERVPIRGRDARVPAHEPGSDPAAPGGSVDR